MALLFTVNSDTTSHFTPEKTNLSSEDLGGGQGQESGTNSIVGEDAKEVGERKSTQVDKQYESYPFPLVEKKVDEITPLLSGLTLSQIEMVLDGVKNRCYLYPIHIVS